MKQRVNGYGLAAAGTNTAGTRARHPVGNEDHERTDEEDAQNERHDATSLAFQLERCGDIHAVADHHPRATGLRGPARAPDAPIPSRPRFPVAYPPEARVSSKEGADSGDDGFHSGKRPPKV